ncbi:hypothetical protein GA0070619_4853 [Micromonospora zamorensis]|nr:hypothetical protein GA0070619_4853 [Micromonospora zamorensis]
MPASTNSVVRCVVFAGTRGARRYGERRAMVTGISDRLPALRLTEVNCVVAPPGPEMTVGRPVRPVPGRRRPDRSCSSGRGRTDSGSARYAGCASRNRGDSGPVRYAGWASRNRGDSGPARHAGWASRNRRDRRSARHAGRARHRCGVGGAWCDDRHAGRRPGRDGDGCRTRRARHGWRRPVRSGRGQGDRRRDQDRRESAHRPHGHRGAASVANPPFRSVQLVMHDRCLLGQVGEGGADEALEGIDHRRTSSNSISGSRSRRRLTARCVRLRTVPTEQPSSSATRASGRSS